MTSFDLPQLQVRELLRLEAAISAELRRRELTRTNNNPLGDIAEQIVLRARGGVLEPNSTKSHDITSSEGRRIQVKGMGVRSGGAASRFSAFRSDGFDSAVFLVFDQAFDLAEAYEMSAAEVMGFRFIPHVNGRQPSLHEVRSRGSDVVAEMRRAWDALAYEIDQ